MGKKVYLLSLFFLLISCTKKNQEEKSASLAYGSAKKNVFEYYRSSDPKSLDPQAQLDSVSGSFVQSIYDTLVSYHYLKRPYQLEPTLLEKMPFLSKDGKKLTFQLRKGVYFHDNSCFPGGKGRELISDDVIYTLKRFADININTQSWFLLNDVIVGLDSFRKKTEKNTKVNYKKSSVLGLEKIDRYQFSLQLKRKNPLILYALASPSLSIVPREAVEKYGRFFGRNPVGTGAYQLTQYRKKQTMVLTKNPNYFLKYPSHGEEKDLRSGLLKDANQTLPLIDQVEIHYIPEPQPRMLKFKKGELSWVALDRDNFQQMAYYDKSGDLKIKAEADKKFELYKEAGLTTSYLVFNLKDSKVKNKNIRKAISHALNIQKKIELLDNGRAVKLQTIVPPSIPGSEKELGSYGFDFDLKKAKSYLAKAGYGKGLKILELTLTLPGTSVTLQNYYEFMRNSLDSLGIKLKADYKTWPSYLKATENGDFQIASAAWVADYPDPENFYQLLYGPNRAPGQNSSNFDHKEYNQLYEQMRLMVHGKERLEIIRKMAKILQEEVPVIFESTPLASGLIQDRVLNFKRNILLGDAFKYFNLKQQVKS